MTIALIDGDILAYLACEGRTKGRSIMDLIKIEAGYDVKDLKLVTLDPLTFTEEQNERFMEQAWKRFIELIGSTCDQCFTEDYRMAVKGNGNFRDDIFPDYKANRRVAPEKRNPFVPKIRERAIAASIAVPAHGMEADDLIRIWHTEFTASSTDIIICGGDKDFKCMVGRHYFIKKDEFFEVDEAYALRFYYEQLLQGDPTDNIRGIPKVGPITARDFLAPYTTEREFQEQVMRCYHAAFGEDKWREELFLTGRLIYLKKTHDDMFTLDNWPNDIVFEQYVVEPTVKKVKKVKEKEVVEYEWTVETALAAIDPESIVSTEKWDSAITFMLKTLTATPKSGAIEAIETILLRNEVPTVEIDAFQKLCKLFNTAPKRDVPLSFQKVMPDLVNVPEVKATTPAFEFKLPVKPFVITPPAAKTPPVTPPVLAVPVSSVPKTVAPVPNLVATAVSPTTTPPTPTPVGMKIGDEVKVVAVGVDTGKSMFALPAVTKVEVPVFSASWGKKK